MNAKLIVLKMLLQRRHLQTHSAFCREYDRVAVAVDPTLRGGWPSRAQFYRWLSGDLIGLPYTDHCRILECMFPGWKVDQLFQIHDGGIDYIPEPSQPQALAFPSTVPAVHGADRVVTSRRSLGLLASVLYLTASRPMCSVASGLFATNSIRTEVYNATPTSPDLHPNRIDG